MRKNNCMGGSRLGFCRHVFWKRGISACMLGTGTGRRCKTCVPSRAAFASKITMNRGAGLKCAQVLGDVGMTPRACALRRREITSVVVHGSALADPAARLHLGTEKLGFGHDVSLRARLGYFEAGLLIPSSHGRCARSVEKIPT